jgi:hypothetical protein
MAYSFIFGGDGMPKTPQELEQMRAVARSMVRSSRTPQNVGEGIASLGDALAYRIMMDRAAKSEKAGVDQANSAFSGMFDSLLNPSDTASDTAAATPSPVIKSPQDAVDASPQQPLTGDLAAQEAYIRQAAQKRGINPDYAVKVARSEGLAPGVWQSRVKKGDMYEPSYGPFQMLVGDGKTFPRGMGNDFMEKTGLDPRDPKNVNQMIDFALDTAKRDGWRQWFGAKKVGVNRWDGINQDQVASLDASVPTTANKPVDVVPVPDGFQQPDPLAEKPTVKVAQALQKRQPDFDVMKAVEVMNNPFLDPGKKAVAETLIKRRFAEEDALRQQQLKQSDPAYIQDLEKGRLELDNLRNPKISPADAARLKLEQDKFAADQANRTTLSAAEQAKLDLDKQKFEADQAARTTISPLDQAKLDMDREKLNWEKSKKPETIQKYEYYKQSMEDLGQPALGPLEWEQALRASSASRNVVNNNMQAENAFDKKLAEGQADAFNKMADEGLNARADVDIINQLDDFTKGQGGTMTGLASVAAGWGLNFEGADDLTAATALINKLVPSQRQPGSGTMSDRDVELFKSSLPSLWNQPGGNEKIIGVMRGLAEYKQRQGEIANQVRMGTLTRQEATKRLEQLPNPLEEFRRQQKAKKTEIDGYTVEEVPE